MAYHRRQGGLDINGMGPRRPRRQGGSRQGGSRLASRSQARAQKASQRAALSRAAKGRGTYIHPSSYGKRERRFSRKSVITAIVVVIVALALAASVGYLVYQQAAKNALKPALNTEMLAGELVAAEAEDIPNWSVLVHTDASSAEGGRGTMTDLALVCVDPDNVSLTFLWIPINTRVYIDGSGYSQIKDAFENNGEAGIVSAMSKLADIEIQHYMEINKAGLTKLETQLAPLSVNVDSASRDALTAAICKKLFGSSSEQMSTMVEVFSSCVATDASMDTIKKAFRAIHGINIDTACFMEEMPSRTQFYDGVQYSVCDTDLWNTMVSRVASGMSPVASASEVDTNKVTRENCTVAVWNGVGVSGVANDCTNELKKLGWNVINTGNANQFVYDETFVVYKDTDDEAAARLLAADLGQGRVVRSAARYSYTGNLLVVVGKDYKPY